MKYRSEDYQDFESPVSQTFETLIDELQYDSATGKLVVVGKIDLQEQLNSSLTTSLDRILDKFLPNQSINDLESFYDIKESDSVVDLSEKVVDLADLAEVISKSDEYKDRFGLDMSMTVEEVYRFVAQKNEELKNYIKKKGEKENEKKENVEKSKPQEFSTNS